MKRLAAFIRWAGLVCCVLLMLDWLLDEVAPMLAVAERPRKRIITIWILLLIIGIPTAYLFWRNRKRIPPGHCQTCGYNLTGNTSGVCPECGERIQTNTTG